MTTQDQAGSYEQALLSYTPTCYAVALRLTQDALDARDLTREVLTSAWERRGRLASRLGDVKTYLLTTMRDHYLKKLREGLLPARSYLDVDGDRVGSVRPHEQLARTAGVSGNFAAR